MATFSGIRGDSPFKGYIVPPPELTTSFLQRNSAGVKAERMSLSIKPDTICFDRFRLERGTLFRLDGLSRSDPVALGSRALAILELLATRSGEVVPKDEILEVVWAGMAVEESNLTVQISKLRHILDEDRKQSFIQTIPGRGYRFTAAMREPQVEHFSPRSILSDRRSIAVLPFQNMPEDPNAESSRTGLQEVKKNTEPVHVINVVAGGMQPVSAPTIASAPLPSLPEKPSLAVLPFINMSTDPEQEFIADGIATDIITALSRFPSLFVIACTSSFTYKGRAVDVKQIGREFGIRYVLEGSLRKAGNRIRMTAHLVETATGNHVWAERYDRNLADIFTVQDDIATEVTIAIAPAIADAESHRAMRKPPGSLDGWGAYQRGLWHLGKFTDEDTAAAERFFEQAIELDPNFSGGYSGLAAAQLQAANIFIMRDMDETTRSAEALARQAVDLDTHDAEARTCLGRVLLNLGDYEGAHLDIQHALLLNPNLAIAHSTLGSTLVFSGHPQEGLAFLEHGIRLDPRHPCAGVSLNQVVLGLYLARDYEGVIDAARRVIRSYPDHPLVYRWLAAALGQLGRTAKAKDALSRAIALSPGSFEIYVRRRVRWYRPEDHAHMLEGLRKAGWDG